MPNRTAATDRILGRAASYAAARCATAVEPGDLLAAVLWDESRGAELLRRFKIDAGDAATRTACFQPDGLSEPQEPDPFMPIPPPAAALRAVLDAAGIHTRQAGRQAELGSEHLVLGLADVASPVAELLTARGATAQSLTAELQDPAEPAEAIPADFVLDTDAIAFDRRFLLRTIDAAANRAAEGLRVAEDYARFVRNDAVLTAQLKRLRHATVAALQNVPLAERLAARDTPGDVGTTIASPSAATRHDTADVLAANLHRAQEALRSLEEFGRLLEPALGPAFERLRYQAYTLEQRMAASAAANDRLAGRAVYVLLTRAACIESVPQTIAAAAAGGAGVFQVREKSLPDRELLAYLREVRRWTREADALLIVNDRPDLAVLCDADGVHVGQDELPVASVRQIVGPRRLIGVSTHSLEQAQTAVRDGADYLGVGPVFPSQTKSFSALAGLDLLRAVADEIALPWYAIGGISPANVAAVYSAGATRVAVSAAVCGAADPADAARALRR